MRIRTLSSVLLLVAGTSLASAAPPPPPKGTLQLQPALKTKMIGEREKAAAAKRTEAIRLLEELLAMKPGGQTAADARFKLAELYWEDSRQRYSANMADYDAKTDACKKNGNCCGGFECKGKKCRRKNKNKN